MRALRRAIVTSAKWINSATAAGQGSGMLNVPGAWNLLRGKEIETRGYTVDAPVCTAISEFLAVPHRAYIDMGGKALRKLLAKGGTLADLKGELGAAADWTL